MQGKIYSEKPIKWDYPDAAGKGGTTTNGNVARSLLHVKENHDIIVNELPEEDRETFQRFGQYLSVIIRVLSSKRRINVEKYMNLCTEFNLFFNDSFQRKIHKHLPCPWISIALSLHKVLGHSWELIEMNDGHGLGSLDESGLEGNKTPHFFNLRRD